MEYQEIPAASDSKDVENVTVFQVSGRRAETSEQCSSHVPLNWQQADNHPSVSEIDGFGSVSGKSFVSLSSRSSSGYDQTSTSGYGSDVSSSLKPTDNKKARGKSMKSLLPVECPEPLGELSPVICYVQSFNGESENKYTSSSKIAQVLKPGAFRDLKNEACVKSGEGFCLAVSLQDGTIVYVSNTISNILGYSKDMLLSQCIMNFLYPRDRITFTNQLTQGLNARLNEDPKELSSSKNSNTFLCRLRQYQSLKFGYGISDKKVQYKPFHMSVYVKDIVVDDICVENSSIAMCLIATAVPVKTAYKVPDEIPAMTCFSTRHTSSCHFSHVDLSGAAYLGFLPQDMLGHSVFDFYHVDDMPQLKDIYELVIKEQGHSFRSKPYRFRVYNGGYVTLETEWSCFINPWSRKLEFVVGQHRVLKGPSDPDVFKDNINEDIQPSDEILKDSLRIQDEIRTLLSQTLKQHESVRSRNRSNKRRRELASFVSSLVDEMCQNRQDEGDEQATAEGYSCSDQGSVVMGEISPHQEFHDSDPSTETLPSLQEIRYQENIERFFASQPKTYSSDGSGESKIEEQTPPISSNDEDGCKNSVSPKSSEGKADTYVSDTNYVSRMPGSGLAKRKHSSVTTGDSGHESLTVKDGTPPMDMGQSSSSGRCSSNNGSGGDSNENYPPCITLTEEVLSQHNRLNHKYMKPRGSKMTSSNALAAASRKESQRLKRSGSPQTQQMSSGPHKHTKPSRASQSGVNGRNSAKNHTALQQPPVSASTPMIPITAFNFTPPPFSLSGLPMMTSQTATTDPSQPKSTESTTKTFSSAPVYTSPVPNFGMPTYTYLPANSIPPPAAPFLLPVMYMGAVPMYPSMSTLMQQTGHAMWQCGAVPVIPMCQQPQQQPTLDPNDGEKTTSQQNQVKQEIKFPSSERRTGDKTSCGVKDSETSEKTDNHRNLSTTPANKTSTDGTNNLHTSSMTERHNKRHTEKRWSGNTAAAHSNARNTNSGINKDEKIPALKIHKQQASENSLEQDVDKDNQEDSISLSCTSSSFLKSDDSGSQSAFDGAEYMEVEQKPENKLPARPVLGDPHWMEGVDLNDDIVYRYQLKKRNMNDVLKNDMNRLQNLQQPNLVNKQLAMLQLELEDEVREEQEEDNEGNQTQKGPTPPTSDILCTFATLEEDLTEHSRPLATRMSDEKEMEQKEDMMLQLIDPDI